LVGREVAPERQHREYVRQRSVRRREGGIGGDGLLQQASSLVEPGRGPLMPGISAAQIEIVCVEVARGMRLEMPPLAGCERYAELARHALGHVGLDPEHVGHRGVERLLPAGSPGRRVD